MEALTGLALQQVSSHSFGFSRESKSDLCVFPTPDKVCCSLTITNGISSNQGEDCLLAPSWKWLQLAISVSGSLSPVLFSHANNTLQIWLEPLVEQRLSFYRIPSSRHKATGLERTQDDIKMNPIPIMIARYLSTYIFQRGGHVAPSHEKQQRIMAPSSLTHLLWHKLLWPRARFIRCVVNIGVSVCVFVCGFF